MHTQNHKTKTTSIGIAPEAPRQAGRTSVGKNHCFRKPRLSGLGAAKLAGGRQGRRLGGAGCGARSGIAPGKATPAAPPPAHPPPRVAAARGWGPEPRGEGAPLELGRERGAPLLPQVALGAWADPVPGLRSGEDPGYRRHAASRPRLCRCAALRAAQVATVHPRGSEAAQPTCVGFAP